MIAQHIRRSCLAVVACGVVAATAHAQGAESFSRVAMDSEVSVRTTVTQDGKPQTNLMIDGVQNVHLFGGWTIISRPMATRRTGAEWAIHLAQFAVRHESTHGRVATRFEAGLLASPVGLGSLTARASDNPTITPAYSHARGVTVEADAPGVQVLPLTYPVGAQFSMSTKVWDARVGVMDATPLRVRWPLEKDQPKPATHLLLAGGVTPRAGLRVGGWFMQGDWAKASEVATAPDRSRAASSGGVEVEYRSGVDQARRGMGRQPAVDGDRRCDPRDVDDRRAADGVTALVRRGSSASRPRLQRSAARLHRRDDGRRPAIGRRAEPRGRSRLPRFSRPHLPHRLSRRPRLWRRGVEPPRRDVHRLGAAVAVAFARRSAEAQRRRGAGAQGRNSQLPTSNSQKSMP